MRRKKTNLSIVCSCNQQICNIFLNVFFKKRKQLFLGVYCRIVWVLGNHSKSVLLVSVQVWGKDFFLCVWKQLKIRATFHAWMSVSRYRKPWVINKFLISSAVERLFGNDGQISCLVQSQVSVSKGKKLGLLCVCVCVCFRNVAEKRQNYKSTLSKVSVVVFVFNSKEMWN